MIQSRGDGSLILHIGLHKTGTKFLQHGLFRDLGRCSLINFNPPMLTQLCCDLARASTEDVSHVQSAIRDELQKDCSGIPTVISREILAGDLFSGYRGHKQTIGRLAETFPTADVLCVMRYQTNWLESVYRESIHEHHYQTFDRFINPATDSHDLFAHLDPRDIDWPSYGTSLRDGFGPRAHFLFIEDLVRAPQRFAERILRILGIDWTYNSQDVGQQERPNRGYSALAIQISLLRAALMRNLGSIGVHRPIYFHGPNGIPSGREDLSVLPKEPYWSSKYRRDNEEVRSPAYPNLRGVEKMRSILSWRYVMRSLDSRLYLDWDLLVSYRQELDHFFHDQNRGLPQALGIQPSDIPAIYFQS